MDGEVISKPHEKHLSYLLHSHFCPRVTEKGWGNHQGCPTFVLGHTFVTEASKHVTCQILQTLFNSANECPQRRLHIPKFIILCRFRLTSELHHFNWFKADIIAPTDESFEIHICHTKDAVLRDWQSVLKDFYIWTPLNPICSTAILSSAIATRLVSLPPRTESLCTFLKMFCFMVWFQNYTKYEAPVHYSPFSYL